MQSRDVASATSYTGVMMQSSEEVIERLRREGLRMTPQRIAIVREILDAPALIVPTVVIERARARIPGVSASTVYRTLERLQDIGVLTHVHVHNGVGYHRLDEVRHAHLVCSDCGTEAELAGATQRQLEEAVEQVSGFRPDFAHHAIVGHCIGCQGSESDDAQTAGRGEMIGPHTHA